MTEELHMSEVLGILGVSLYVLGFGLGPLVFAPLGELYGRVRSMKYYLSHCVSMLISSLCRG